MDGSRFDTLTRAISSGIARRGILQALIAALAGDALGLTGMKAAACPGLGVFNGCRSDGDCAACGDAVCQWTACRRPTGGKCRKNRQCASGSCNRNKRKCRGCDVGQTICGGRCDLGAGPDATSPDNCSGCYVDTCAANNFPAVECCAGSATPSAAECDGGHCTGCRTDNEECTSNRECCTNVCGIGGKCGCTASGKGCVRHVQCCSNVCQPNGRCGPPCGNGKPPCNGVCCPSGQHCVGSACLCDGTDEPPCGGIQCCAADESCEPAGCVGGVGD
jgi:hypothetical protein